MNKQNSSSAEPQNSYKDEYDKDENGTKVIIRKFNIPLGKYLGLPSQNEKRSIKLKNTWQKKYFNLNNKWKYQHDVPDGKIFTKLVHTSNQHTGDLDTMVPIVQPVNIVAPVRNSCNINNITINNVPENVLTKSLKVIRTEVVNGRKLMYLKTEMPINQKANQPVCVPTSTATVEQSKSHNQIVAPDADVSSTEKSVSGNNCVFTVAKIKPATNGMQSNCYRIVAVPKSTLDYSSRKAKTKANNPCTSSDSPVNANGSSENIVSMQFPLLLPKPNVISEQGQSVLKKVQNIKYVSPVNPQQIISGVNTVLQDSTGVTSEIVQSDDKSIDDCQNLKLSTSSGSISGNSVIHKMIIKNSDDLISTNNFIAHSGRNTRSELTLIPTESAASLIDNSSKYNNSVTPSEALIVVNHKDNMSLRSLVNINHIQNSNVNVESNVIFNKMVDKQNEVNTSNNAIPKSNVNDDVIMRRRKIALQYQQDIQRRRKLPRIERTFDLPTRKVSVADAASQTSLFSLLESGKMVEMCLNEDIVNEEDAYVVNNEKTDIFYNSTQKEEISKNSSTNVKSTANVKKFETATHSLSECSEKICSPLSKRSRLDESNFNATNQNSKTLQNALIDESIISIELDETEKENLGARNNTLQTNAHEIGELDVQNTVNNIKFKPLVCKPHMRGKSVNDSKNNMLSEDIQEKMKNHNVADSANNNAVHVKIFEASDLDLLNLASNINSDPLVCGGSTVNSLKTFSLNGYVANENNGNNSGMLNKTTLKRLFCDFRSSLVMDNDGNMPIHNAVMYGHYKMVQRQCLVLNAQKKTVDLENSLNKTPLHLAVLYCDKNIVELLLKNKARPDTPDGNGNTALHMAIAMENEEIFSILLDHFENHSPALNHLNDDGYSPLHLCVLQNKFKEASLLIRKGVCVNIRDIKSGRTPLFLAVENNYSEMSRLLISAGASTTIANYSGQTPLTASEVTLVLDKVTNEPQVAKESKSRKSCPQDKQLSKELSMDHHRCKNNIGSISELENFLSNKQCHLNSMNTIIPKNLTVFHNR